MSGRLTGLAIRSGPADRVLTSVLIVLTDASFNDGRPVVLPMREIAVRARLSLSATSVRVGQLIAEGWIEVVEPARGPFPASYRVLFPQGVETGRSVRPSRTQAFGNSRTQAFGNRRTQAF